jgi:hypothetical protein
LVSLLSVAIILSIGMISIPLPADEGLQEMEEISKGLGLINLEEAKSKALGAKTGVIKFNYYKFGHTL